MKNAGRRRTTIVNLGFKYLQVIISVVSGFLLVPFYLRFIPVELYGGWLAIGSVSIWLAAMDPGLSNLVIQKVGEAYGAGDEERADGYVLAGTMAGFIMAFAIALAGIATAPFLPGWIGLSELHQGLYTMAFRISSFSIAGMVLGYLFVGALLGKLRSWEAGIVLLSGSIVRIVVVVWLLLAGTGLMALPYSGLAAALWILVVGGILVRDTITAGAARQFGFALFRELFGLFSFTFGARLGKVVTQNLDNVFIARMMGSEAVALFGLTSTAPKQSANFVGLSVTALRPGISHLAGEGREDLLKQTFLRIIRWLFWGLGLIFAGVMSLNPAFVKLWVGPALFAGSKVSLGICLMFLLRALTNSLGTIAFSMGDIRRNSLMELANSLLMVPALYLGIRFWGLLGAALGMVFTLCVTTLWYFPLSLLRRLKFRRDELTEIGNQVFASLIAALVCIGIFVGKQPSGWAEFIMTIFLLVIFYSIVLLFSSKQARKEVKNGFVHIFSRKLF